MLTAYSWFDSGDMSLEKYRPIGFFWDFWNFFCFDSGYMFMCLSTEPFGKIHRFVHAKFDFGS